MYGTLQKHITHKADSPSAGKNSPVTVDSPPSKFENSEIDNSLSLVTPNTFGQIRNKVELIFCDEDTESQPMPQTWERSICHFCGKYVTKLAAHLKRYHGSFKCKICCQTFITQKQLEEHIELHGNNKFPCEACDLSFKTALDSAVHSREHSGLKSYKCPLCEFDTATKSSVKIHIKHHEQDYNFHCELCEKGFISKSVYMEHMEGHSGVKRYRCDICNKSFLHNRYLKVHRKLNHKKLLEGVEEVNQCHVCNRRFSFNKSLMRHLSKIHNIGKDNSVHCPVCLKKISNPYNLKMHMRIHTGEKPYVCEVCGKSFSKKVYLKRHCHMHESGGNVCKTGIYSSPV